jgi:hypothetical protein
MKRETGRKSEMRDRNEIENKRLDDDWNSTEHLLSSSPRPIKIAHQDRNFPRDFCCAPLFCFYLTSLKF